MEDKSYWRYSDAIAAADSEEECNKLRDEIAKNYSRDPDFASLMDMLMRKQTALQARKALAT